MEKAGITPGTPIRILLADDHVLVREGLVRILSQPGANIQVIGEASDGSEAVAKARELQPHAVLMDLSMAGMDGFTATRLIKEEMPEIPVIVLTVSSEEDDIAEAIRAGARGYIVKTVDASDLIRQIKQVITGSVALSGEMTTKLVTGLAHRIQGHQNSHGDSRAELTHREREVLALIAQGATNKEIAANLIISEHTVRAHVRSLMQKLNMENRTKVAVYGLREGFVPRPQSHAQEPSRAGVARTERGM